MKPAFALFAADGNFSRHTGKADNQKRPTAAMMPGLAGHVWSFDDRFEADLTPAIQS